MLTRLRIENFRVISLLEMDVSPLTVVTGANGSGKSSILQAIWMCYKALSLAIASRTPPQVQGRTRVWNDLPAKLADLCPSNEHPSSFIGAGGGGEARTRISLDFDDANPFQQVYLEVQPGPAATLGMTVRITVTEQLDVSLLADPVGPKINSGDDLASLLPTALYFPASYGVQPDERWISDQEVLEALYGGQQKHVLRNMIARLDDSALEQLNALLADVRGTKILLAHPGEPISPEERLTVTFEGPNGPFELLSAGAGLTNFISLYAAAAICRQRGTPGFLLLDEPELHLNPRLQGQVGDLLATAAETWGAQAIFVTHSIEMMNLLRDRHGANLFQMNGGNATHLLSQEQLIIALNEWRDLTPFETMSFMKHRRLLFVEGKTDSSILSRCADVYFRSDPVRLDRVNRWLFRPLTGVGKGGVPVGLAQLLTPQVFSFPNATETLKIVSVLDRDYSRNPAFQVNESVAHLELFEVVWSKHSIESQFLTPSCLASWLRPALGEFEGGRAKLELLIETAIAEADRDRDLLYKAHDGLRQVLLARGKTLAEATSESRETVDANPATWQRGKDRAAFVLRRVREALPLPLQRKVASSIVDIVNSTACSVADGDLYAVPEEIRRLLDHLSLL